ncbi:tRNA lysidine(34) synthetase TilS [Ekhidna sp.]|uniref:tRNA lysidine(34) synthetase TilS n=1 Tax=Ekhidna sp. TaxID=2608089 RepID=UPI003B513300
MHSLQKQFHDFIHSKHLINGGEKILLAVSGGVDSMVLSDLFLKEGFEIAIAHCNFGLRGEESNGDEVFVLDWADKNGINCFVKAFDLAGSIQLEARNVRYQWFNELLLENGLDKIATAHHLNDSLETVLNNLARGTGVKGLAGIPIQNEKVIRPLLFATKKEIHDYAMDVGIDWREDSSNETDDYDRNHIRHHVIPELEKVNPSILNSFILTQERITHASHIVSERVQAVKKQFLLEDNGGFRLELNWISAPSDELILADLLTEFGVNYTTSKEIFEARGKSGKSFIGEGWFLTMDRSELFIDKGESENVDLLIQEEGEYVVGTKKLVVEIVSSDQINFGNENEAFLNHDKIKFPLSLRNWKEGDRFQPLGMRGMKKISDFFIDLKIPQNRKKEVLILEAGDEIAWVVGYRISESFKLTTSKNTALKLSFIPQESP